MENLLDDVQIKIGAVLTDIHGVSGRAMMEALIAGNRDPRLLARLGARRAKRKTAERLSRREMTQRDRST
ncbi:MAG: hypothetical protein ACRDTN_04245 [Mycobacterium sp.]